MSSNLKFKWSIIFKFLVRGYSHILIKRHPNRTTRLNLNHLFTVYSIPCKEKKNHFQTLEISLYESPDKSICSVKQSHNFFCSCISSCAIFVNTVLTFFLKKSTRRVWMNNKKNGRQCVVSAQVSLVFHSHFSSTRHGVRPLYKGRNDWYTPCRK